MTEKEYVSMEAKICPVCGKTHNRGCGILMDRRLKKSLDPQTVTGYALCEEHQRLQEEGYVFVVGVDEKKSSASPNGSLSLENAYRTGRIASVRKEAFNMIFQNVPPEGGMVFADNDVLDHLEKLMTQAEDETPSEESPE